MSAIISPLADLVRADFPEWETVGDILRVHTHCLYADGQGVFVDIYPASRGGWLVTDGANGWNILREHLVSPTSRSASRRAEALAEKLGADYVDGAWCIDKVSVRQLVGSILLVANASQRWTNRMLELGRSGRHDIIESRLILDLVDRFGSRQVEIFPSIRGSNKSHEFSALVSLRGGMTALFEAVTPFPASLYASYAKMNDVRSAVGHPTLVEAVIRDASQWKSDDVALLRSACDSVVDIEVGFPKRLLEMAA